jgi:four helix bundle protein
VSDFAHERLDVYGVTIEFLGVSEEASELPRGGAYLVDQLRRESLSVTLNVAEGAGEFAPADKARFYRMARRSGTECVAILDACRILELTDAVVLTRGARTTVSLRLDVDCDGPAAVRTGHGHGREMT